MHGEALVIAPVSCPQHSKEGVHKMVIPSQVIHRHKTAIHRADLSRPIKAALHDGLIFPDGTVFDYGCGHGQDIELLAARSIACDGWDPAFRPDSPKHSADVVNLGYVLNVIEDVEERTEALRQAWGLARRLLIVAAQVKEAGRGQVSSPFGDGVLTGRGTFQKFFGQGELKGFLEAALQVEAIPASLGVFYVFRDETLQQQFIANRYRRRAAAHTKATLGDPLRGTQRAARTTHDDYRRSGPPSRRGRIPSGTRGGRGVRYPQACICPSSAHDRR